MSRVLALTLTISSILISSQASAQVIRQATPNVQLSNKDTRAVTAPGMKSATLIPFIADPVSAGGDLFDIVSADPRAHISLVLPDGREINAANAAAMGFGYVVVPQSEFAANAQLATLLAFPGTHTIFQLPGSLPGGTYDVKVNTSAITTATLVIATYISMSPVQIGLLADAQVYRIGETVVLSGLLFQGSSPVNNAKVTARISDPSRPNDVPIEVSLTDSAPQDAAPGDGLYTGTFVTTSAGKFAAAVRATGFASNGSAFSRTTATTFRVIPPLANMASFSDQGVDDDANGLFNRIVVTANVNVQTAGKYQLSMNLVASNGLQTTASTKAALVAGTQQVKVGFPAQEILRLGVNGPYVRKNVSLIYQDDPEAPVVDYRETGGNTQAYTLSSLEKAPISLMGRTGEVGIDTNSNGKFDVLRLQAGINVATAGSYQWSASLADRFGTEIDFTSNSGSLIAGNNNITFNFDGKKIGANGTDGPYAVQGFLIFGSGNSLVAATAFNSTNLFASAFENFANKSEVGLTQTGSAAKIQTGSTVTYAIVVTNKGPNSAINTTISDALPAQSTFVSCAATGGGICGGSGNNRTISYSYLDVHQSETITLVAQLNCALADNTTVANVVSIATSRLDEVTSNNGGTLNLVAENPPPIVTAPGNVSVNSTECSAAVVPGNATVSDNCPGTTLVGKRSDAKALNDAYPPGTTTIQWTATDTGGNASTANQTVTVVPMQAVQLSSSTPTVSEGTGRIDLTVTRSSCNAPGTVTVNYGTSDTAGLQSCTTANGKASERCDYVTSLGTVRFAAGESSKTLSIPIIDDVLVEGTETFTVTLANPTGASFGANPSATVTITDNDTSPSATNPIDGVEFFILQQYRDILNRQPDSTGFQNWINTLANCPNGGFGEPPTSNCDRLHVAAGFFQSDEFLNRGYWAFRFYMVSFQQRPSYSQFIPDMAQVGGPKSPSEEETSKAAFAESFVQRSAFTARYGTLSGQALANALAQNAGLPSFTVTGNMTNGQILRAIAERQSTLDRFLVEGTVAILYFGFQRRDPDAIGYQNNLATLNASPNNLRHMIFIFIYSTEYRQRFGPP